MLAVSILTAFAAVLGVAQAAVTPAPAAKPTGGPAVATLTVFSGPFTCTNISTPPPTTGEAGTSTTVSITEDSCTIIDIPFGGVMTTTLTATPKERTAGCWLQIYTESGCGLTLTNEFHGFPFNGVSIGSSIGCVTPPVISYGAAEVLCD